MRYAASKGCLVTGMTLSQHQAEYIREDMSRRTTADTDTVTVLVQDFFDFKPIFHPSSNNNNKSFYSPDGNGINHNYQGLDGSSRSLSRSSRSLSRQRPGGARLFSPTKSPTPPPIQSPLFINRLPSSTPPSQRQPYTPSKATTTPTPAGPALYDAISVMGVLEELGYDYDKILAQATTLLRPGGRVYLEFAAENSCGGTSASQRAFVAHHIFPCATGGRNPSSSSSSAMHWVNLPKFLQAVEKSALVLDALWDNRHNYHLWAYKCYQKLLHQQDDFCHYLQQTRQCQQEKGQKHNNQRSHGTTTETTADTTTILYSDDENESPPHHSSMMPSHFRPNNTAGAAAAAVSSTPASLMGDLRYKSNPHNHNKKDTAKKTIAETSEDDGEYLFRLLLAGFAGAAASMAKQDHHCTAYRMVLKLPES